MFLTSPPAAKPMRGVLVPDATDFVLTNPRVGNRAWTGSRRVGFREKAKARRKAGLRSGEAGSRQREHSIATNCSHWPPPQMLLSVGTAPVMSSLSTLWNDTAWANSRDRQ